MSYLIPGSNPGYRIAFGILLIPAEDIAVLFGWEKPSLFLYKKNLLYSPYLFSRHVPKASRICFCPNLMPSNNSLIFFHVQMCLFFFFFIHLALHSVSNPMEIKIKIPHFLLRKAVTWRSEISSRGTAGLEYLKMCYVGTGKSANGCWLTSIHYGLAVHTELMKAGITDL